MNKPSLAVISGYTEISMTKERSINKYASGGSAISGQYILTVEAGKTFLFYGCSSYVNETAYTPLNLLGNTFYRVELLDPEWQQNNIGLNWFNQEKNVCNYKVDLIYPIELEVGDRVEVITSGIGIFVYGDCFGVYE